MSAKQNFLTIVIISVLLRLLNAQTESLMTQWNNALLLAAFDSGYNTLILARVAAIMHNAMFNALVPYDSKLISDPPTGFCRQPKSQWTLANKKMAISYAAYFAVKELLSEQIGIFDQLMEALGYDTENLPSDSNSPARIGARAAEELLKFRRNDRSNQLGNLNPSGVPYSEPLLLPGYKTYKYINTVDKLNDINYWQPLRNPDGTGQTYQIPHWGEVIPFALASGSQFTPTAKPIRTNNYRAFVAQARQIYDISKALTPEQELIALYWDGQIVPAASPWHGMAAEIAIRDNYDLDEEVKLFFAISNVLFDAMIASWNTKRLYNAVRPITVIRKLIDPTWDTLPLIPTPPHPDFTSGHAVLAASAAVMFEEFTGSDYYGGSYTDPTGIKLSWETFEDTVQEAGLARLYAGIHTENSVVSGQEQGRNVGRTVWKKIKRLIGRE